MAGKGHCNDDNDNAEDPGVYGDGGCKGMPALPGYDIIRRVAERFWSNGILVITTAALAFSLSTLAIKLISPQISALEVVFLPGVLCWLVMGVVTLTWRLPLVSPSGRTQAYTLLRGVFGAISTTCFFAAIQMLPIKDAVTLFFCNPVIAAILESVILGHPLRPSSIAGILFTVAGAILISRPTAMFGDGDFDGDGRRAGGTGGTGGEAGGTGGGGMMPETMMMGAGVVIALVAATANASAFMAVRLIRRRQSAFVLTFWYHSVVCAVTGATLAALSIYNRQLPAVPSHQDVRLLLLVALLQLTGQVLLNRGFQLESATRGSAINVMQVLFSCLLDVWVLGDQLSWFGLGGVFCVGAGVTCITLVGSPPAVLTESATEECVLVMDPEEQVLVQQPLLLLQRDGSSR